MNDRPDQQAPPFDERAALDELERLRGQIERQKARRREVEAEFEGFIRSFKAPPDASEAQPDVAAINHEPQPFTPVVESSTLPTPAAPPLPAPPARRPSRDGTRAVIGGALVVLAGTALATWTWTRRAPAPSTVPAPDAASRAAPSATPEPPAAAPVTASPFGSELSTSRAVWVRVLADGERVVERELPANARVPLKA